MFNQQIVKARANIVVRNWASAVKAAGGGFENNSLIIANNFITAIRSKSYYSKIIYLLPMLGAGINAARVPLIDTLSVGTANNVNFVDADFNQSVGLVGNGTLKIFDTLITPVALGNTAGVGFWYLSAPADQYYCFTATSAGEALRFGLDLRSTSVGFSWGGPGNGPADSSPDIAANYYGQQSSVSSRILYRNGIQIASNSTLEGSGPISTSLYYMGGHIEGGSPYYINGIGGLGYLTNGLMMPDEILDFNAVLTTFLMVPSGKSQS